MCDEKRRSVKAELKRMNTTGLLCSIAVLVGQGVHAVLVVRDELDTHLENRRACVDGSACKVERGVLLLKHCLKVFRAM